MRASEEIALRRELTVRNATAGARDVRFGATPAHGELNGALHVAIAVEGQRLFSGTLERLRRGSAALRLEAGATAAVAVRLWIPAGTPERIGEHRPSPFVSI